jgi:type I restriction enzyme S subunit
MKPAMAGWELKSLNELGFVGRGKSRHRPRGDARLFGGPHPFIQTADIMSADPYITQYLQTYSEFGLQQSKKWPANTLCLTIAGANTAKTAILKFEACFPDSVVGFLPDENVADLHFVKYSLDTLKDRFLAITRGATQDNLSLDKLLSFKIPTPSISTQRRIAAILSAYDDLIENSRKRCATLEDMARRLYIEWFVHFRYPGHEAAPLVDSPLGLIPQGWNSRFSEVALISRDGITPADETTQVFEHFSIPAFDAGGVPLLEQRETILSNKFRVVDAAILLSKLNPRIPRIWYAKPSGGVPAIASSEFLVLRPTAASSMAFLHGLCSSDSFYGRFLGLTGGTSTSHQRVRPETLLTLQVQHPPKPIIDKYDGFYLPIIELAHKLRLQISNLRRTRDLLLPRLMSGMLSVNALATAEAAVP